jgi:biopolymer transport protein ExbB/TolQ
MQVRALLRVTGPILAVVMICAAATGQELSAAPGEEAGSPADTKAGPAGGPPSEPFSVERVLETIKAKFLAGGATMWVILFLSVLGLAFLLERAFRLRRSAIAPAGLSARVNRLWNQARIGEIEAICSRDSPLLRVAEILDWQGLSEKLTGEGPRPAAVERVRSLLTPEALQVLRAVPTGDEAALDDRSAGVVVNALNAILRDPDFYREQDFRDAKLGGEVLQLLAAEREDLSDLQVQRLNRLLLQAALPEHIAGIARKRGSTLGRVVAFIVRHRDTSVDAVSEGTGDIAGRDMAVHQMLTYPLAAVATLSPLLGLFGTVLGMIESFETVAVAGSMGDPTLLADGISKALVTTAFGLFVAIPMLFFYHLFKMRTTYLRKVLEGEASTLINDWLLAKGGSRP